MRSTELAQADTPTSSPAGKSVEETATQNATPATAADRASAAARETTTSAPQPTQAAATSSPTATETVATEAPPAPSAADAAETQPGISPEQQQLLAGLENYGPPPELHNTVWLNSGPLKLSDLRGKVVLVEFWTFGCINCIHVIPSLREWHNTYQDDGLVIIGVHTPEFENEKDLDNVQESLVRLGVPYAVALDNDWETWRAYRNRYWPAEYLIDKAGDVRYIKIGEGDYQHTEEVIQALLAEEAPTS